MSEAKTIVYSDPGCPVCVEVGKVLKPAVKAGKVKIVKEGSKKAKEILKSGMKIRYVPECVKETSPGHFERCDIESLVKDAKEGKL